MPPCLALFHFVRLLHVSMRRWSHPSLCHGQTAGVGLTCSATDYTAQVGVTKAHRPPTRQEVAAIDPHPAPSQGCYNEAGSYQGKVLKEYMMGSDASSQWRVAIGANKGELVSMDACAKAAYENGVNTFGLKAGIGCWAQYYYEENKNKTKMWGIGSNCNMPCQGTTVLGPDGGGATCGGVDQISLFWFNTDRTAACPSDVPQLECPLAMSLPPSPPSPPAPPAPPPRPPAPALVEQIDDFGDDAEEEEPDKTCEDSLGCMFDWSDLKVPAMLTLPKIGVPGTPIGEQEGDCCRAF